MENFFANRNLVEDADLVLPLNFQSEKGQELGFTPMVVFATNASRRGLQEMRQIINQNLNSLDQVLCILNVYILGNFK